MSDLLIDWKYCHEMDLLADQSDRELLTSFVKTRCERSFTLLVRRYAGLVHGVAARTLDQGGLVDDVGQLTFLLLSQKASKLLKHGHLAGWLHRTAYQQALNLNRGQRRARQKHLHHQEAITMSQSDQKTWQEIVPILDRELQTLSASDRALLVKRFFAENSLKELAAQFGISQDAAEKRLQRALAKLRDRLNRKGSGLTISALFAALTIGGTQSSRGALASQWAAHAMQASPQSISLFAKFLTFIAMKKALSLIIVVLLLSLFWSQSPWSPFSSETGSGNGVGADGSSQSDIAVKSERRRTVRKKSATISGRVLDRETGAPVSGAKVIFHSTKFENPVSPDDSPSNDGLGRNYNLSDLSDREGNYILKIPDASRGLHFWINVASEGYCRSFMKISTDGEGHRAETMGEEGGESLSGIVRAGDKQIADFKIVKESLFRGVVTDQSGNPIPEVKATLWYHYGGKFGGGSGVSVTKSNEKGGFELNGSPASVLSGDLEIKFNHPDFVTKIQKGLEKMTVTERASMEVALDRRFSLEGLVIDSMGKPVSGAKIVLRSKDKIPYSQGRFTIFTDSSGEFRAKLMWPGKYSISAISLESLELYEGEVTVQGTGELDINLNALAGEKKESLEVLGLSLMPLAREHCQTFSGGEIRGGLLVTGFQETDTMKRFHGVGNLIYAVFNPDRSWDHTDQVLVNDLPSLARGLLKHAKHYDDGTAVAKVGTAFPRSRSMSESTIRLSKADLIWLEEKVEDE